MYNDTDTNIRNISEEEYNNIMKEGDFLDLPMFQEAYRHANFREFLHAIGEDGDGTIEEFDRRYPDRILIKQE